jgi:hypothetical protein
MTTEALRGVLTPDGSLQLDHPSSLPPGQVEVIIHSIPAPASNDNDTDESWWQYLQRVHAEAEAAGGPFRSAEDIERERADFRAEGDDIPCELSDQGPAE